ncbi:hypothetical protein HDV02_002341 [Globomyces sp. JEL0801]|nr:hypothetical protein HDV02_002341 [Globomyces sp. JEL0801]
MNNVKEKRKRLKLDSPLQKIDIYDAFSLWIRSKIKYVLTIRQPKVGRVLPTSGTEDDLSVENSIENIQAPTHRKTHRDHHRQEAGSEESLISTSTGCSESDLRIEKQTDLIVIHRATHILPDLSDDGLLIPSFVSLTGFDDGHYLHFSIAKKATFMGVADPNCVVMKTRFNSSKMLRKKRYLRVIFNLLGVTVLASLIIGLMAGTNSYFAVLSSIADNENHKVRVVPPFCHTVIEGLKIVDYVKLSQVMYQPTPANFNGYPKLKNFTEVQPPTVGSVTHRFFHHQISNLTVISVRGTKSFNDNLEDLYMYAAPALLTASTYFVELVAHLVYYIIRFGQNSAPLEYWEVLGKEIDLLQADGRAVVITGHSLGGALAGVLAAKYQIPGIGVCAPGLGYQTVTYGFTIESLVANFVNIIPNHDVVTMVDIQYGNLQSIPCYGKSPLDCHMINRTLGVIESFCGST